MMTARKFFGFPITIELYEYTEPVHDERRMRDGRPAYAWWNEIQMLRQENAELKELEFKLRDQFAALRIAEWAYQRDILNPWDTLLVLRITAPPITKGDAKVELLNNLDKYVKVEKKE